MNKKPRSIYDLYFWLFFVPISILLIVLDYNYKLTNFKLQLNSILAQSSQGIYQLIRWPFESAQYLSNQFIDQNQLIKQVKKLEKENILLKGRLQELASAKLEIERYKRLFDFAYQIRFDQFLFVNILRQHNSFLTNQLVINKGLRHQVYLGQPIINNEGIIGQVSKLGWNESFITLITNSNHAIPVETENERIQGILKGNGTSKPMHLEYIRKGATLKTGDQLYASGQGGIFPRGYPVAKIINIQATANDQFLIIQAEPNSNISNTREALLIWPNQQ